MHEWFKFLAKNVVYKIIVYKMQLLKFEKAPENSC